MNITKYVPNYLKEKIKGCLRRVGVLSVIPKFTDEDIKSYSQYQDDLILDEILGLKSSGCYVDIGANHPQILSNTKRFYDRGWRGINIEPILENYNLFVEERKMDINLNLGISDKIGTLDFYLVDKNGGVYSSLSKKNALRYAKESEIKVIKIPVRTLESVLDEYLNSKEIDFMSIDVEGLEIQVLQSNDWTKYRPNLIIIEFGSEKQYKELMEFFKSINYKLVYSNGKNGIFQRK